MTIAFSKLMCMRIACAVAIFLCSYSECRADEKLGLPASSCAPMSAHPESPVTLGSRLFSDKRLSGDGTISCATCHEPQNPLSDGRTIARGARGTRNTPSLWNVCYMTSQFWEGRRQTLEQQARDPLHNPREHGVDITRVLAVVRGDGAYQSAFAAAFEVRPDRVDMEHVSRALAAFERTLVAGNCKRPVTTSGGMEMFIGSEYVDVIQLDLNAGRLLNDRQFHR